MAQAKLTWIQTRDGSPTLWHNEISESYRSVKGAFTESFKIFAEAALKKALERGWKTVQVGEFGLGAGTNWLLWSLLAHAHGVTFNYWAIEKDLEAFEMGRAEWPRRTDILLSFVAKHGASFPPDFVAKLNAETLGSLLNNLAQPVVYPTLEDALHSAPPVQIWFHDPFGYDTNPEGYSEETLTKLSRLWSAEFYAYTYACNSAFQRSLSSLGLNVEKVPSLEHGLKRESLSFFRRL